MNLKGARWVILAVLGISGVIVACRILLGPLSFPLLVNSPLNSEGIFGLAVVLMLLINSESSAPAQNEARSLDRLDLLAALGIVAVIAVAYGQRSGDYFLSDDFILLKDARGPWHNLGSIFTTAGGDGFYRPFSDASFAWISNWAGLSPFRWHFAALLLHSINAILVLLLARALGFSRFAGLLASVLFAIHGTRPEAVVWITPLFDRLATFFVLAAFLLFILSWDSSGTKSLFYGCVSLLCMILGCLSKESGYALPVLLTLFVLSRRGPRFYVLIPFFAAAAGLFAYRWSLFHGIGGYVTQAGQAEALSLSVTSVLKTLGLRIWAILFFPINWSVQPGLWFGLVSVLYIAALAWFCMARVNRMRLFILLGYLVALAAPPLTQLLIGTDLEKSRQLYLPCAGFCLLIAYAADRLTAKSRWAAAGAILVFNAAALSHNLPMWEQASDKVHDACRTVAQSAAKERIAVVGLPRLLNGVYSFANGFPECVEMNGGHVDAGQATQVFSWDPAAQELKRR